MMIAIYKYKIRDYIEWIEAPVLNWLKIDWQKREGCYVAWATVDLGENAKNRKFQFLGIETGRKIDESMLDGYQYIDSINHDYYVLHWFVGEFDPETDEVMKEDNLDTYEIEWRSYEETL